MILLDLHRSLITNYNERRVPFVQQIKNEVYHLDLINALRAEKVLLMSARPMQYRDITLKNILDQTGYQPDFAYFNEFGQAPHICKERLLRKYILPLHQRAIAIETDPSTRKMYATHGIPSLTAGEYLHC